MPRPLMRIRDDDGEVQPVSSDAVNEYLREAMGETFTAKDFRTWGGTLTAVQCFARTPLPVGDDGTCSERALAAAVAGEEVEYTVGLPGEGAEAEVFFSDLSHEYVTINAEYTT